MTGKFYALRAGICCALALLLLTPFVHAPGAVEPLAVGKALWSRSLIAIVVALWAPLALARPDCRPPRSWLLVIMVAGLGVALLSALAGESPQRSFWSDYARMGGLVDRAHWVALTLVLASLLRRPGEWRALIGAGALAGAAVAGAVVFRAAGVELPIVGATPEPYAPRYGGPFGNPVLLSAWLLPNLALAAGFALRAWTRALRPASADSADRDVPGRRAGRKRRKGADLRPSPVSRFGGALLWTAATALLLAGLRLADSLGAFVSRFGGALLWTAATALLLAGLRLADSLGAFIGLYAAVCVAALAWAALARGRLRAAAAVLCVLLALAAAAAGWRFAAAGGAIAEAGAGPERSVRASLQWPSVQSRLASWETGLRGFAARPLLGWGPENYVVVFGRYARGLAATSQSHDRAHNAPIEVAATTGLVGLSLWLAQWALAPAVFCAAARAAGRGTAGQAKNGDGASAVLYVAAAAALAGQLTQLLSLFDTVGGTLAATLLFAWAARLESELVPERWRPRPPGRLLLRRQPANPGPVAPARAGAAGDRARVDHRLDAWRPRAPGRLARAFAPRAAGIALAGAAVAAALAGLAANRAILAAADARYLEHRSVLDNATDARIERFPALANAWRYRYFEEMWRRWEGVRAANPAAAASLLRRADREARAAARAEPGNWRIAASLARVYRAVAETDPAYAGEARAQLARARELAPNRDVFPVLLTRPAGLTAEPLPGGRLELRWRPGENAGYHALSRSRAPGVWEFVHFSYDPARRSFAAAPCAGCRYRIKACRYQRVCTKPVQWPAPQAADGGDPP